MYTFISICFYLSLTSAWKWSLNNVLSNSFIFSSWLCFLILFSFLFYWGYNRGTLWVHMIWYFACSMCTCSGNLLANIVCFDEASMHLMHFDILKVRVEEDVIIFNLEGEAWKCEIQKLHRCGYVNLFLNWKMYKLNQISGMCCNLATEKIFDVCIVDFFQQYPCGKLRHFDKIIWEQGLILGFWRFSFEFPRGQIWHFATEPWEMPEQNLKI